jgi:4-amino-4-deoxy-L-arabinose transferase-like glycosyltransferase
MTSTRQTLIANLVIIVFLTILVRLPWLFMIPVFEAPDETLHYWVINYCAQHLDLPSHKVVYESGPDANYGSIPQFGYVPHILLIKLLPCFNPAIVARCASLVMACILNTTAYLIGQEVFLSSGLLAFALPAMIIFHPQLVFIGSYANSDMTASALSSMVLLLLIRTIKQGLILNRTLWIGFLSGWVLLSKYSGACVIPTVFIFLSLAAWLHRSTLKISIQQIGAFALMFLTTCGWWFVRNYYEFNGDISGVRTLYFIWATAFHKRLTFPYVSVLEIISTTRWWRMNFHSFWAVFGYMNRFIKTFFYFIYLGFVALSAIGGLTGVKKIIHSGADMLARAKSDKSKFSRQELIPAAIWAMFFCVSLSNIAASALGSCSGVSGPQGRYFFPSEVALISLLLAGLYQFKGSWGRGAVIALVAYNFLTYLFCTHYLYLLYNPNFPFYHDGHFG